MRKKKKTRTRTPEMMRAAIRSSIREVVEQDAKQAFIAALRAGMTWNEALKKTGCNPIAAATACDDELANRRDGATVFLLAENYLIDSMDVLRKLAKNSGDDRIKCLAASKLADTAYNILINRPYIEKMQRLKETGTAPNCFANPNIWDAHFEAKNVCEN